MTARISPNFPLFREHIASWERMRESDKQTVKDDTRVINKLKKSLAQLEKKYHE